MKMNKQPAITYLVEIDPKNGRWNVTRNSMPIGAYSRDKGTAVGKASQAASFEQAGTSLAVAVWSVQDGKRQKEWPG
jgi:hypothetical protein